jgi:hypothetical protein
MDGTIVASGTMTLIADGDYKLTFNGLTNTQYLWQSDAGSSLPHSIRYVGNSFKENVISSVEIRDALLEDPTPGVAAARESIDYRLRQLLLLVDQLLKKFKIGKNDYR